MPREGTRSATGNSKPRVFQTIDTAPATRRTVVPKKTTTTKAAAATKATPAKGPGRPKKEGTSASEKVKSAVKVGRPKGVTKKKPASATTTTKKAGVGAKVKTAVKKATTKAKAAAKA